MKTVLIYGGRSWGKTAALINRQFLLSKHSLLMDIELELHRIPIDTALGFSIVENLENKVPVAQVAREIYTQSRDNRARLVNCIGESLMQKIEKLCQ